MSKILKAVKKFFRRFNVVNITLLLLCLLLTFAIVKIWTHSSLPEKKRDAVKASQAGLNPPVEVASANPIPVASYESIPLKNLFRPNRKEWEPEPPPPLPPPPPPPPPPPQPPPELKLHGVIILGGDKNVAIMSGSYLEGGNKVDLKAQKFKTSQLVSNYRITEITEDKTILKKEGGDDVLSIPLVRSGVRTDLLSAIKKTPPAPAPAPAASAQGAPAEDKKKDDTVINLTKSPVTRTALLQPSDDGIIRLSRLEPKFSITSIQPPPAQGGVQHISGAATAPVSTLAGGVDSTRPPQHISGVVTQPPPAVTSQGIGVPPPQHISGATTGR